MKWLEDMNRAMDYIENTICEKTDYEAIAKVACCSVYHFQRMFTFMTDITLSTYIRRRKMTSAAYDLINSDCKVIDLALKYGYDSPEAFTRAFKTMHEITPSEARKKETLIKAYPKLTFQLTIQGTSAMKYQIVEKEAFEVYGIETIVDTKDDSDLKAVPEFWLKNLKNGENERLIQSAGAPTNINAVIAYETLEGTKYPYMLCVLKTALSNTEGYKVIKIPKSTWIVFENEPHKIEETPEKLHELSKRIYKEWLPSSEFELKEGLTFEMYFTNATGMFYEQRWFRVDSKK